MKSNNNQTSNKLNFLLWSLIGIFTVLLIFARIIFPDEFWITALLGFMLILAMGYLIVINQSSMKTRSMAYGVNSIVTVVLVISIIGVLNFLASRHPFKWDVTKNKLHTFSDQTKKVITGLNKDLKVTYFCNMAQREQQRPLLENYKSLSPHFSFEFVNPDTEPTRTRQAGVKTYGTMVLSIGSKEMKVDAPDEEKMTNTIIKLLKDKSQTLCSIIGHGEKSFEVKEAEGLSSMKTSLSGQSYELKEFELLKESHIPETCDAILIWGPRKAFFPEELKKVQDYLNKGGRALFALDVNLEGHENSPELLSILKEWHVQPVPSLIVDPLSKLFQADASVAILANYAPKHPITKDFKENCLFPFTMPLEIIPGAPAGMNVQWIAQTTPKSWAIKDLKRITKDGGAVQFNPSADKQGPLNAIVSVEGKKKDSQATKNTRLVVFGTSFFASNYFSRYAANGDLFMNAVSWALEDESLISIRTKEDVAGQVELSQKAISSIFFITVFLLPITVAIGGIIIWRHRKKL